MEKEALDMCTMPTSHMMRQKKVTSRFQLSKPRVSVSVPFFDGLEGSTEQKLLKTFWPKSRNFYSCRSIVCLDKELGIH